jgi:hypothetical protein
MFLIVPLPPLAFSFWLARYVGGMNSQCLFWLVVFIFMEGTAVISYNAMLDRPGGFHISVHYPLHH